MARLKFMCSSCESRIPEEPFCPRCGHPTSLATFEERILWELGQWEDSRTAARSSGGEIHVPGRNGRAPAPTVAAKTRFAEMPTLRSDPNGGTARRSKATPAAPQSRPNVAASAPARSAVAAPRAPAATAAKAPAPEAPAAATATIVPPQREGVLVIRRLSRKERTPQKAEILERRARAAKAGVAAPALEAAPAAPPVPATGTVVVEQAPPRKSRRELRTEEKALEAQRKQEATALEAQRKQEAKALEKQRKQEASALEEQRKLEEAERKRQSKALKRQAKEKPPKPARQKAARIDRSLRRVGSLKLHDGETVSLSLEGWCRFQRATLVVTRYRVALITRLTRRVRWIPLEEVEKTNLVWRGSWALNISGSIEVITFQKHSRDMMSSFYELLQAEVREARAPGARRHHADVIQDWCDRSTEMWDSNAGRFRLWIRRHPIISLATLGTLVTAAYLVAPRVASQ